MMSGPLMMSGPAMMSVLRRLGARLGILLVVLSVSGCLGIRADESVRVGLNVDEPSPDPAYNVPAGPTPGAVPDTIIRDFLRAEEVTAERLAVAQSFLTTRMVAEWEPGISTEVIDSADSVVISYRGDGWYDVKANLVARIDAAGRAVTVTPGSRASTSMRLERVDGQWRIGQADADFGRWVRRGNLQQVLRPQRIYYPAANGRTLIPDVRWLPVTRLATGLTRALIGPPPAYLEGAVRTGLGSARLSVDAVPVDGSVATVPLIASAAFSVLATRVDAWGQLVATLTEAPNISAVRVTLEETPLQVPGVQPPVLAAAELGFRTLDPAPGVKPVVRVGDRILSVDFDTLLGPGVDLGTLPSAFPRVPATWGRLALSFTGSELAAVGDNGTGLARYRADGSIEPEGFADRLTGPAYDRDGWLWVGGRPFDKDAQARLWTIDSNAEPFEGSGPAAKPIVASWLVDRLPIDVAFPVDGTRIAVVSTDATGKNSRLDVAGVARDADGTPTTLAGNTIRLGTALSQIREVVWLSPTDLAVLAGPKGKAQPYLVTLGDVITPLGGVEGADHITTAGGARNLAVRDVEGHLLVRAGASWQPLPEGLSDLVPPGR